MLNIDDTRAMLQRSRSVADNADFLALALSSGDHSRIKDTVDDLLNAYDNYTGQAKIYSSRLGFDEMAKLANPEERDQAAANALANTLIDLEVAVVLGRAAQATSELDSGADPVELDKAVYTLNETLKAIEGQSGAAPGTTRYAFDEVTVSQAQPMISSPDVPTAKATYEKEVKTFYDALLAETSALIKVVYEEVSGLDADKIKKGIETTLAVKSLPGDRLAARALEAAKRAIDMLKSIIGLEMFNKIEERINKVLNEIVKGENLVQLFIKGAYRYETGQKDITIWLQSSHTDHAKIDAGTQALRELQQQMVQAFSLLKRILTTLHILRSPLDWILKKWGGTLPLDLVMGGVCFLVIDVGLLRGMDYADATPILKWVDGVIVISKRTLGVN